MKVNKDLMYEARHWKHYTQKEWKDFKEKSFYFIVGGLTLAYTGLLIASLNPEFRQGLEKAVELIHFP